MAFCVLMGKLFKTGKPRRRMVGKQPGRETQGQPFYLETMQEAMGVLKDNPFANAGKRLTGAREASRGLVRRQSKANAAVAPSAAGENTTHTPRTQSSTKTGQTGKRLTCAREASRGLARRQSKSKAAMAPSTAGENATHTPRTQSSRKNWVCETLKHDY